MIFINIPILGEEFKIDFLFSNINVLKNKLKEYDLSEQFDVTNKTIHGATHFEPDKKETLIWINSETNKNGVDFMRSLAHESCHAMFHLCDYLGQEPDSEFFCYSIDFIIKKVMSIKEEKK